MEARIARLESDVTHLLSDVADIKADVRGLRDQLTASLGQAKDWAVGLYLLLASAMAGTFARAFGWL